MSIALARAMLFPHTQLIIRLSIIVFCHDILPILGTMHVQDTNCHLTVDANYEQAV